MNPSDRKPLQTAAGAEVSPSGRRRFMDAIKADWAGYQSASEAVRGMMRKRIADEQRLLVPLLRRMTLDAAA